MLGKKTLAWNADEKPFYFSLLGYCLYICIFEAEVAAVGGCCWAPNNSYGVTGFEACRRVHSLRATYGGFGSV